MFIFKVFPKFMNKIIPKQNYLYTCKFNSITFLKVYKYVKIKFYFLNYV